MFELKVLSKSAIDSAFEKVERYRLLNEPESAESICRDVLAIDPENQSALTDLILSLTDQFDTGIAGRYQEAKKMAASLNDTYDREYYSGIVSERRAKSILHRGAPGSGGVAYEWLRRAMEAYERAEEHRPQANDDAKLRWNTCARIIMDNPKVEPYTDTATPIDLE